MTDHAINMGELNLDNLGRIILPDEILERINASPFVISAGGANDSCSNGECANSTNSTACTNTSCTGSKNQLYCVDGPI